jgi:hydrogenase expression/formation protein HypC
MCLAVPCKVIEILPDQRAIVDMEGLRKDISLAFVGPVDIGTYVILHVGYAIGVLDSEEAEATLRLFQEFKDSEDGSFN